MPGLDGMGPMGQGPMTGRKMGICGRYGAQIRDRRRFWATQQTAVQPIAPQGVEDLKIIQDQLKQDLQDIEEDIKKAQAETK